jgi:hypothetical protein
MTARVIAVAVLGCSLLGGAATNSSAMPRRAAPAVTAKAPHCQGKAKRLRSGSVSFSFTCANEEDITGFEVQANRTLHSVEDPSEAFGCERSTATSFACEDIHSGAGPTGSAVATVSEPLCRPHADLLLRITPAFNFEGPSHPAAFTLRGPC